MVRYSFPAALLAVAASTLSCWGFGGPDLVVCRVGSAGTHYTLGFSNYGPVDSVRAFAADSLVCNYGDLLCTWDADQPEPDDNHPVFSQSLFRLNNGRITQVGQSWLKHGGFAVQNSECGLTCVPASGLPALGVGCCDAYNALTNGTQFAGPKQEINPFTGAFPFPFCTPANGGLACPSAAPTIGRRLQANAADLVPSSSDNQYFFQIHIITPDEINVSNPRTDLNNASYRRAIIGANGAISQWAQNPPGNITVAGQPAIHAWRANGLGVGVVDPSIMEVFIDVIGDGRFHLAARATSLGSGRWHYEYAVMNYNSHREAQSFTVPLPVGHAVSNLFFHDVDSHSGDPRSNVDWASTINPRGISWNCPPFAQDSQANSLRWDTLYNFAFDASGPPALKSVNLGMFRPFTIESPENYVFAMLPAPDRDCNANDIADSVDIANDPNLDLNLDGTIDSCPPPCRADINADAQVNVSDLLEVISAWGTCAIATNCAADVEPAAAGDGLVNVSDLLSIISAWGPCPGPIPPPPPPTR